MIIAFYCLSSLDVLDQLDAKSKKSDRDQWREWIWAQQICQLFAASIMRLASVPTDTFASRSAKLASSWGTGFRSGPSVAIPASNVCPYHMIISIHVLLHTALIDPSAESWSV
jgi:hypothetical protein